MVPCWGDIVKKSVFVNFDDIKLEGSVLDLSVKGSSIIPSLMKLQSCECDDNVQKDYIKWDSGLIPSEDSRYDTVTAMFSFGKIISRYKTARIIKEVSRVLKRGGKIIIFDINSKGTIPFTPFYIEMVMPDRKVCRISSKTHLNKLSADFESMIRILEKNDFIIKWMKHNENIYKIVAENNKK